MKTFSYLSLITAQHQKDFFYSESNGSLFCVVTKYIRVELKCRTWKDSVNIYIAK